MSVVVRAIFCSEFYRSPVGDGAVLMKLLTYRTVFEDHNKNALHDVVVTHKSQVSLKWSEKLHFVRVEFVELEARLELQSLESVKS